MWITAEECWRKIRRFTALTSFYCCYIGTVRYSVFFCESTCETFTLIVIVLEIYNDRSSQSFLRLQYLLHLPCEANTNKRNPMEHGAIMNCRKGLTVIDCDSCQHLKKFHYWGLLAEMKNVKVRQLWHNCESVGPVLFPHKTLPIEKSHSMMDAWYLLTFTFLSKELSAAKPKNCCDSLSIWFIPFIYSSFLNFRDYLEHIFTFS